jgi:FMN reductase [NAD(P)H]
MSAQGGSGELERLLARRRMCRAYLSRPVPEEILRKVLEAARRAPSAGHAQGVRFGVVTEAGLRARIAQSVGEPEYLSKGFPPWFSSAPVHLLVGASAASYRERYEEPDKSTGPDRWPVPYDVLDGGKALMTLYLAAVAEGLACGYLGPHRATPALQVVPWPDDWRFLGLVSLGYPDRSADRPSRSHQRGWRPFESVVRFWGEESVEG